MKLQKKISIGSINRNRFSSEAHKQQTFYFQRSEKNHIKQFKITCYKVIINLVCELLSV